MKIATDESSQRILLESANSDESSTSIESGVSTDDSPFPITPAPEIVVTNPLELATQVPVGELKKVQI